MYFSYEPLPTTTSTRLLQILSASEHGVSARLIMTDIESAPPYDALSYTWGSPWSPCIPPTNTTGPSLPRTFRMMCNSRLLDIGQNLRDALISWHNIDIASIAKQKSSYLWVDAICINQQDLDEKAVQVRFMEEIYRRASKVVAWLGPEDETVPYVFEMIARLSLVDDRKIVSISPEDMWRPQAQIEKLGIEPFNYMHYLSWVAFMHRPYFKRVWIVQEQFLAQDVIGLCGGRWFKWSELASAWYFLVQTEWANLLYPAQMRSKTGKLPPPEQLGIFRSMAETMIDSGLGAWNLIQGRDASRNKQWLLTHLLERHRYCQSTDPRDMVYALIGVARKNWRPFDTQPELLDVSYRISVQNLYTQTARGLLLAWGNLSHLDQKEGSFLTSVKDLPSWVPDYSVQLMPEPLSKRNMSDALIWSTSANLSWKPAHCALDDPLLGVQGRFLGLVQDMAPIPLQITGEDEPAVFWRSTCEFACGLKMPYASSFSGSAILQIESRIEVLWRTLLADNFSSTHPAPPSAAMHFLEHLWILIIYEIEVQKRARRWTPLGLREKLSTAVRGPFPQAIADINEYDVESSPYGVLVAGEPEASDLGMETFLDVGSRVVGAAASQQGQGVGFDGMHAWRREQNIAGARRRLFSTNTGLLGLGPIGMDVGDEAWILAGASTPFVLRRLNNGRHKLLGQAYVHGIMHGEAVEGIDEDGLESVILE